MYKTRLKIASILLSLVLTLSLFPYVPVYAAVVASGECGDKGDNVKWELDDSGTLRIFGEGAMNDYTYDGILHTLSTPWGDKNDQISVIEIGSGVSYISDYAFYNCTSLSKIDIPESVTSIGDDAFYNCTSLISIEIPTGVTSIGDSAFSVCSSLTSIEIPAGVTSIGDGAFSNCTSLTSIDIPDGVTSIGDYAFSTCTSLTSIDLPESVTSIGKGAFILCSNLTSIEIPTGVTSIGDGAFSTCTSLTSIDIPDGVISICDHTFDNCTSLTSIDIPASVTSIGERAFFQCSSLESITIPGGVTSIGDYAFFECSSLESITIPGGVTSIGNYAFDCCEGLTSLTIPDSVKSIDNFAFCNCLKLSSLTISRSLFDSLDPSVFGACYLSNKYFYNAVRFTTDGNGTAKVKERDYTTGVVELEFKPNENYALDKATYEDKDGNVVKIEPVNGVYSINTADDTLFDGDIPVNVYFKQVGGNCGKDGDNVKWAFDEDTGTLAITGTGEMADWNNTSNIPWYNYREQITSVTINDGVTSIGNCAFENCTSLTSIDIPTSVTSIGDYAFYYCTSLKSIEIPTSVTSIGEWTFYSCASLTNIEIPNGVTSIGDNAFYGCKSLTSIDIPASVTSIGKWTFYSCASLTNIEIPASVTSIGYSAFTGCTNLEKAVFLADTPVGYDLDIFYYSGVKTVFCTYDFSNSDFAKHLVSYYHVTLQIINVYDISYDDDGHGTISGKERSYGTDVVEFVINPYECYVLDKVVFTDNLGNTTELKPVDGKYTMPASDKTATVKAFFKVSASGTCGKNGGDNLKWSVDDTGTLIISGTGEMDNWFDSDDLISSAPWGILQNEIKTVIIQNGVTSIGEYAFSYCHGIENVTIADSVTSLGEGAFKDCENLATVTLNKGLKEGCDKSVFENCNPKAKFIYYEYDITYAEATNGTVSGAAKACDTDKVDLNFTPAHNYAVDTVTVTDKNKKDTTLEPDADGKYSFEMPRSEVTVTATFKRVKADVTFSSEDGKTVYETKAWDLNTTPSYSGTPSKEPDAQYTYTFYGWTDGVNEYKPSELPAVTKDVTYKAVFRSSVNKYTVTFKNYDGTELKTITLAYGKVPAYSGDTPAKAQTKSETFEFSGWTDGKNNYSKSDVLPAVTGKVTYTALFTGKAREYTVKFVNESGTVISTKTYPYGTKAEDIEVPAGPEKKADQQYTYIFAGWGDIKDVTGDAVYSPSYDNEVNKYTVTFKNYDGTELKTITLAYGKVPAYSGDTPAKAQTKSETFEFSGWTDGKTNYSKSDALPKVAGNVTYTALFTGNAREYTVKFIKEDGTEVASAKYPYGTKAGDIVLPAGPAKKADQQYTYTFAGWGDIKDVTGDAVYTANYKEELNKYTVTFKNYDGTELQTLTLAYNTVPAYSGKTPAKEKTQSETFEFSGWTDGKNDYSKSDALPAVGGNVTYTALFTGKAREYTVKFVNESGTAISSKTYPYGTKAGDIEVPAGPEKKADPQYTYIFAGWGDIKDVTGDAVYSPSYNNEVNKYTVTFENYDGTELQTLTLAYDTVPTYTGKTPAKEKTQSETFEFSGWTDGKNNYSLSDALPTVAGNVTYTALFTGNAREYTIKFVKEDGTEVSSARYPYGTKAADIVLPEGPEKEADKQFTYAFAGWGEIKDVTGDATYKATYSSTVNEYTVKFVKEDGTEISSKTYVYGTTASGIEVPAAPEKEADAQYTYTFKEWYPAIATVTGDATYKATYSSTVNEYTIKFVDEDGTVLQSSKVAYGELPSYTEETPTKAATAQYTYTFAGWTPAIAKVTDDAIYTATYKETVNEYTIKFVNEDGTVLQSSKVAYGELPSYTGETPTKASTAQYTYTFAGWTPEIAIVTGDATYKATYTATVNKYTIKFVDEDGTELQTGKVAYGELPSYTGATPTKKAVAQYTYTFAGWTPEIAKVTGDATYTATYTRTVNEYTVTFVNYDGTVLQSGKVAYGTVPEYTGATPVKAETDKSTFVFAGWNDGAKTYNGVLPKVTGDVTYKAVFTEVAKPEPTPGTYYLKRTFVDESGNMYFEIERLGDEAHTIDYYDQSEVDNKKVNEGQDADIYSGSVIIKLRKEYLDTLSEGTHTLKVYFKDDVTLSVDFVITRNTDSKADIPSTGEIIGYSVFIGAGLIALAGAIFGTVVLLNKRKKRAKDTSK